MDCINNEDIIKYAPHEKELRIFSKEQDKLELHDDVLYRCVENFGEEILQLVVPLSHRFIALRGIHDDIYHVGFKESLTQLKRRFYWPFMSMELEDKVKHCVRCIQKGARTQKAPMKTIVTTHPLELLSIDFLSIECKGDKQNVLVMMDHFTKFGVAVCTRDQTAKTVAKVLWHDFFMVYGFCSRLLSDQGRDFESQIVKELCSIAGIKKCRTTPYHPSGNPVERWNRTLLGMLRGLENNQKDDWRRYLPEVTHAYNACVHSSTGFSPYYLMFGRHPRLPVDLAFGVYNGERPSTSKPYVKALKERLSFAYKAASESMKKMALKNKVRYDVAAKASELCIGDRVLVRRLGPRDLGKLTDKWEDVVHVVISRRGEMPVYTLRQEDGQGPVRTLHRNFLLPIGYVSLVEEEVKETVKRPVKSLTPKPLLSRDEVEETEYYPLPEVSVEIFPGSLNTKLPNPVVLAEDAPAPVSDVVTPELTLEAESVLVKFGVSDDALEVVSDVPLNDDVSLEESKEMLKDSFKDSPGLVVKVPLRRSQRIRKPKVKASMCAVVKNSCDKLELVSKVDSLVGKLMDESVSSDRFDSVVSVLSKLLD